MEFIKKNYILILIIILGAYLRINTDTFISGYIYDEFAIVSLAKLSPLNMFIALAQEDYHAPLYYLIAHIFTYLNNSEIYLRLLNVTLSLANIYIFYKIGNLLKNKTLGYFLALFLAVNHLQISITNFIKFYCLDILLVSLSVYFLIYYIKNNQKLKLLTLTNFFLNLGFTFSFVFVFFEYLFLYFQKKEKNIIKHFFIANLGFLLYLPILLIQTKNAFNGIISAHGSYPNVSFYGIYTYFNDYFSPLINYAYNVETVGSSQMLFGFFVQKEVISLIAFIILSLIPVIIAISGIFNQIKKKKNNVLFYIALAYFIFYIILAKLNISGFVPIYNFYSGVIFIILSISGLCSFKSKIKYVFLAYIIFAQLIIPNDYPLEKREFKNKLFGNIDEYVEKIDKNTPIIAFDAGRFTKYYYKNNNIFSLDYEQIQGSHKRKLIEILYGREIAKNANKKNYKEIISPIILNNENKGEIDLYLEQELFSKIPKKGDLILIFNSDGCNFIQDDLKNKENLSKKYDYRLRNSTLKYIIKKEYENQLTQSELGDIVQSYSTKLIINSIEKKFKIIKIEQLRPTILGKYTKTFETTKNLPKTLDLMNNSLDGWIFVTYQKK